MFEDYKPIEHSEEELLAAARIRSQKLNEALREEAVIRPVYVFKNFKGEIFLTEEAEASAIYYGQVQRLQEKHEYLGKTDNNEYLNDLRTVREKVRVAKEEARAMADMNARINRTIEIEDNRKKAMTTIIQRLADRADKTKRPPSPRTCVYTNATPAQLAGINFK